MNKIFKVIFSKAKGCYVVTSEIAKTHAKSTSKTTAKILTALILTAMAGMGSSYAADNVTYDDAYPGNTRITLTTGGVVVDNVKNGDIAKGSKQAVNGGQLYDVNQKVVAFDGKLADVQTNIAKTQTNVTTLQTKVNTMKDTVDTVNDTLNNGITMTANGKTIKNINPSDMSFNYKAGKNISLSADANGSLVITAKADGKVARGDTNLVSGDAVNTAISAETTARTNAIAQEVRDRNAAIQKETDARTTAEAAIKNSIGTMAADGSYAKKANSLSANITALDTQAKKNADAIAKEVTARGTAITNAINKEVNDRNTAITAAKTELQGQLTTLSGNAVQYTDATKASIALGGAKGTKITNVMAGDISNANSTDAVNGGQLFTTNKNLATEISDRKAAIAQEVKDRDAAIKVETDARKESEAAIKNDITKIQNMTNITDAGKTQIKNLSKEAVKVAQGENITITSTEDENGNKTYTVKATMGTVAKGQTGLVSGDAVNTAIENEKAARTTAESKINTQIGTINTKIGTMADNGNYVKAAESISANITALDTQAKKNADAIAAETTARTNAIAQEVKDRNAAIQKETDARTTAETAIKNSIGTMAADGTYAKKANSLSANITALDTQAKKNADAIAAETTARTNAIAQEVTDRNAAIKVETDARTKAETAIKNSIGTMTADGSYAKKANSLSANITALDTQAKANADAIAKEVTARGTAITNAINKEVNDRNTAITAAKTELQGQLTTLSGNAVQYTDATKASIALGGAKGTQITNVMAGDISKADSTDAVNGGQLFTTNANLAKEISDREKAIAQEVKDRDAAIKVETDARKDSEAAINKAITNIQNMTTISDAGKTQIKNLSKEAVKVAQGENITVTAAEDENGNKTYTVKATMGTIAKGQTGLVSGDAVNTAIEAEKTARTKAVNTINNTIGTIAADGNYIQKAGTISANLSALDVGLHGLQTTYNTRAAKYDGDDNVLMTLAGKGGTRITNLKEGAVNTTSTDAINGSQLANTESKINGIRESIDTNTTNITKLTETINANQTAINSASEMVNNIADNRVNTNLSNLTVQGQNKLKNIVQDEIAKYMKTQGQIEESTATVKTAPAKVQTANIMTAGSGDPVTYDDAYEGNTRITLTTGGVVVDNVSDGEIAKGSKQAVNGGQLFTMQQTFAQYDGRIATIQENIAKSQGNIATNTTKLITLGDKVSDITDAMNTGINVTVDGHTTTTITKDNPQLEFTSGEYITLANKNGKISVSVNPNGTAAPGNKGLMTGDAVYQAIKDIPTNTTLNGKTDTNLGNLTDEGKTNIKNLAKEAVTVEGGNHITVESTVDKATGNKKYTVNVNANGQIAEGNTGLITGDAAYKYVDEKIKNATVNTDQIKQAMKEDLDKKADTTYVNQKLQEKADKTYVDTELSKKVNADGTGIDADKFSQKVAIGEVKEGENRAVSGDAVNKAIANATQNLKESTVDKDLSNISDKAKEKIGDIAKDSVKVIAGTNTTVTEGTDGNAKTYQVNVSNESIKAAVKNDLDQKLNKDLSNLSEEAKNTIKGTMKEDLDKKVNTDASNINKEKWTEQLGTGNVTKDNKELVTGGTVYDALQKVNASTGMIDSSDGSMHIGKEDNSTKVDFTNKDGKGRVLTGIVTDEKDASSAANVGYVAKNMEQAYADMNQGFSRLNSSINKGVAGANALAALHPMEFDPGDKMSFAVGYGHYKGGNAAAIGAYYRPNENIMVNAGVSFGNGETGINAGVSFKLGQGSAYNGVSKAQMIDTINNQATTIEEIQADNKNKDSRIENLEQENQEMKKQIQEILKTLGK